MKWLYEAFVRISQPFSVMRMVCSICTARELSDVTMVHLSCRVLIWPDPSVKIGSIAKVIPAFRVGPLAYDSF